MIKVLDVSSDDDLSQFSRLLWQHKISHRIHHLDNRQILTVPDASLVMQAGKLYRQWHAGEIRPLENDSSDFVTFFKPTEYFKNILTAFQKAPLSLTLIAVCGVLLLIAPLNGNPMSDLVRSMLYPDFSFGTRIINLDRVVENFSLIYLMKMISPILLHGGLLHLAFNMLWLWEFGRRIEAVQASWFMLVLIIVVALFSNTVQFLYGGSIYFGGMSGVVYGLFGYIVLWQLIDPAKSLALPGALVIFLLLSLVVMTAIDLEMIADEAHIGGLVAGAVFGAISAVFSRIRRVSANEKNNR